MSDRVDIRYTWPDKDRFAFWGTVRLRMADLRLDQARVAEAMVLDRANLSRRLTGRVSERPSYAQVERLAEVLNLAPSASIELMRLAGYPADAAPARAGEGAQGPPLGQLPNAQAPAPSGRQQHAAGESAGTLAVGRRSPAWFWAAALMILLAVTLCVGILMARAPGRVTQEPLGKIATPSDGSTLPLGWIDLEGSARLPKPDEAHVWIIEHLAGYYWPQQQALVEGDHWAAQARLGAAAEDVGKRLDLLLVLTPDGADRELRAWLEDAQATGDYRPMRGLPAGAHVLDQVAVTITAN